MLFHRLPARARCRARRSRTSLHAEAAFLEQVIALHPEADGKPCVIGNCQAGWAVMMLAAIRPELFGPIIIAGRAACPTGPACAARTRCATRGGLYGGSWLTALTGDLGAGMFDGAWLVQNFENHEPGQHLWTKQYNLWAKVDTEADALSRVRELVGRPRHSQCRGDAVDRRQSVRRQQAGHRPRSSPATACASTCATSARRSSASARKGDNITPPQQALGWILDLYESVDDIRAHGQTIVYCVHDTVGHLGIFVSGGVARKEHEEFASNIDFIDVPAARPLRGGARRRARRPTPTPTWSAATT